MNHGMTLENNIITWRERVNEAAAKWGGCEVCAVTKTVDVETINRARAAGIRTIGENRVQELMSKIDLLNQEIDKYNNDRALFENAYDTMSDWWTRTRMPLPSRPWFRV